MASHRYANQRILIVGAGYCYYTMLLASSSASPSQNCPVKNSMLLDPHPHVGSSPCPAGEDTLRSGAQRCTKAQLARKKSPQTHRLLRPERTVQKRIRCFCPGIHCPEMHQLLLSRPLASLHCTSPEPYTTRQAGRESITQTQHCIEGLAGASLPQSFFPFVYARHNTIFKIGAHPSRIGLTSHPNIHICPL